MEYRIREANLTDLDAIMLLEQECFANDAWSVETMRSELVAEHTRYLVVEIAGELVGYAGLSKLHESTQADIQTIAVRQSRRGSGLGRELMKALTKIAKSLGAKEISRG